MEAELMVRVYLGASCVLAALLMLFAAYFTGTFQEFLDGNMPIATIVMAGIGFVLVAWPLPTKEKIRVNYAREKAS